MSGKHDCKTYDLRYEKWLKRITVAERLFRKIISLMLILSAIYLGDTAMDMYRFTHREIAGKEFTDFNSLSSVNPDIAAWLRLEGTNVDYPVVQGKDNFEYLSKDFEGNDYAGGCIFIDSDCSRDFSDGYVIIHGHNMAGGAMFSDLGRYKNKHFFDLHSEGELLTPDNSYDLKIAGIMSADAYDSSIYHAGGGAERIDELKDRCIFERDTEFSDGDILVVLSTCSGDMTNERTVILARARIRGREKERGLTDGEEE